MSLYRSPLVLFEMDRDLADAQRTARSNPADSDAHERYTGKLRQSGQAGLAAEKDHQHRLRNDPKVYANELKVQHEANPGHFDTLRRYRDAARAAHPEILEASKRTQTAMENHHHLRTELDRIPHGTIARRRGDERGNASRDERDDLIQGVGKAAKKAGHSQDLFHEFGLADEAVRKKAHPESKGQTQTHHVTRRFITALASVQKRTYAQQHRSEHGEPYTVDVEHREHAPRARRFMNLLRLNFPNAKLSRENLTTNEHGDVHRHGFSRIQIHNMRTMRPKHRGRS